MPKDSKKHIDNILEFPCEFPIKVMGPANIEFEGLVVSLIRKHYPQLGEAAITSRYSKDNTYISMTITINATSQEQLDAIYQDLSAEKKVLLAL